MICILASINQNSRTLNIFTILFLLTSFSNKFVKSNSDGQCCRKRIECYECDSRFDPRCGDPFNLTRDTGSLIYCDDLCVKLKHKFGNQFYYIRSCADTFKKLYIKKTDVCYSTRIKEGGNLCFCDHELCNSANANGLKSVINLFKKDNFKNFNSFYLISSKFLIKYFCIFFSILFQLFSPRP